MWNMMEPVYREVLMLGNKEELTGREREQLGRLLGHYRLSFHECHVFSNNVARTKREARAEKAEKKEYTGLH
jgi:hypothetical protein